MQRYTELAYLFHQRGMSLLSRDGYIADCTVRHPGEERPFSSINVIRMGLLDKAVSSLKIPSTTQVRISVGQQIYGGQP